MQRSLPVLVVLGTLTAGCSARSGETRLAEPHEGDAKAVVDFRVEYATKPEHESRGTVMYGDSEIGTGEHPVFAQTARVAVRTELWHLEPRTTHELVRHSRTVYKDKDETDSCYSRDSKGRCESHTVHRSVSETEYYSEWEYVTRLEKVAEGACAMGAIYRFEDHHHYRVTSLYRAPGLCEIRCIDDSGGGECGTATDGEVAPAPTEEKIQNPLHAPGIGLVVLGGAGLLASAGLWLAASAKDSTIDDHCDAKKTCDAEGLKAVSDARRLAAGTTIALLGGGAAVTGGIVMFEAPAKWVRVQVGATGPRSFGVSGAF